MQFNTVSLDCGEGKIPNNSGVVATDFEESKHR